ASPTARGYERLAMPDQQAVRYRKRLQNAFMGVSVGAESGEQLGDVIGAAGLHGYVNRCITEVDAVVSAVIRGFDDVGAVLRENSRQAVQCAGIVRKVDTQANQ